MSSVKTRIKQKNDSTANWNTANAEGFKPLQGEIIVYNDVNRIKIGDGSNTVSNVPFLDDNCVHLTDNETINGYKKFENPIAIKDSISNSDIMLGATNAANNPGMAGEITWHDGEGNDGIVYIPQGQDDTLATCYKIPDKHFQPFAVGDDLSGQTLYFNNQANYSQYFLAVYTILTSSGGYSIEVGGPPDITLKKNGTIVATFYTFSNSRWLESYTLPSDFGTIETLDSKGGSEGLSNSKPSIWYTLGLGPAEDYINIDVEDVYNDIKTAKSKIPAVSDYLTNSSTTDALSANQGRVLNLNKAPKNHASTETTYGVGELAKYGHVKVINGDLNGKTAQDGYAASQSHTHSQYAPKANPSFTGSATINGNLTVSGAAIFQEVRVDGSAGTEGQVLTSRGSGHSPQWKDIPVPSNMVNTWEAQTIDGAKTFTKTTTFQNDIKANGSAGTSGQVLMSQGAGNSPKWSDVPTPSNMVTTDTVQTISGLKYFSGTQVFEGSVQIANGGSGIQIFNTGDSFAVSLVIDESSGLPEDGADVLLPVVDRQLVGNLYLVGAVSNGTQGQVLTSAGVARAATWSTLPAFAMNTALPISYRLSSSSNGYYNGVSYGTASTVNCLMTRDLPNHVSLTRHISYCIHLSTTIAAGRWVRFDVPSISHNNITYYPYIKTITATPIKTSTSSTSPALVTHITNDQSSGGYAYVGCCSQQLNGLDVRIDCIIS